MTREEKLKMLLHPEQYTDEQLDQMLDETQVTTPDANKEWQRFKGKDYRPIPVTFRWAAMFIGVLMLSGIAYAAIHFIQNHDGTDLKSPAQETQIAISHQQKTDEQPADSTATKPVVFEDAELCKILSEMATFYQYETVYKDEKVKHVRLYFTWDKTLRIDDVIETFNKFERFHITRENKKLIVE